MSVWRERELAAQEIIFKLLFCYISSSAAAVVLTEMVWHFDKFPSGKQGLMLPLLPSSLNKVII